MNTANTKDRQEIQVRSAKEYRCQLTEDYCRSVSASGYSWDTPEKRVVPEGDPGGLQRENLRPLQLNRSVEDLGSAEPQYLRYQCAHYSYLAFCFHHAAPSWQFHGIQICSNSE